MTKTAASTKTGTRTTKKSQTPAPAKAAKVRAPKPKAEAATTKQQKVEKLSAIDAAAQVLAEAKEPMSTTQMIEAMAQQKLWVSPGGKTPERTLYSAVLREINAKGKESRFQKTERGRFVAKA